MVEEKDHTIKVICDVLKDADDDIKSNILNMFTAYKDLCCGEEKEELERAFVVYKKNMLRKNIAVAVACGEDIYYKTAEATTSVHTRSLITSQNSALKGSFAGYNQVSNSSVGGAGGGAAVFANAYANANANANANATSTILDWYNDNAFNNARF